MAIKFDFDKLNIPQKPTFVLMTRSGVKQGLIPATDEVFKANLNGANELSFTLSKSTTKDASSYIWDKVTDFKLLWCKEWNSTKQSVFEMYVELEEGTNGAEKHITATSLGEAELSQIMLYDIEINTEDDIARDEYVAPTVFFNETDHSVSLLHRIMEKAPHYTITHVDASLKKIQRTFSFDGTSLYDAFMSISEEIDCLFEFNCYIDDDGKIIREINVSDLESNCKNCGYRGNFLDTCPECGATKDNVTNGYGEYTNIFISVDNLTDDITYSTDNSNVKNCFRLEGGDDLMTATITNCNPNGTQYIYYITDEVKADMSAALVNKLNSYDTIYTKYRNTQTYNISGTDNYNTLVKYYNNLMSEEYETVLSPVTGFSALTQARYNVIDFEGYLTDSLMPTPSIATSTSSDVAAKIYNNLTSVGVQNITSCSKSTAESAILGMAKVYAEGLFKITINDDGVYNTTSHKWTGTINVENYSDEDDSVDTSQMTVSINGDYEQYVKEKIDKLLNKDTSDTITDIVSLFKLDTSELKLELHKYSLNYLKNIREACQGCIDTLIGQGIANNETWSGQDPNLYEDLYLPYREKLQIIDDELTLRDTQLGYVATLYDSVENNITTVQDALDFKKYIGDDLWKEFASYRRESSYQNSNYISDGLTTAELIDNAIEFINVASKELYKSASLQHSISSTLANLLVIDEFKPLVDYFELGNWIKIKVNDNIYNLKLLSYEVQYNDLSNLSVEFSDITLDENGISSILKQASSMASSYDTVVHQAKNGSDSKNRLDTWVQDGLDMTLVKIVNTADEQTFVMDSKGLLAREYLPITDSYDDKQLKIINRGLYLTDDDWLTARAGIGDFIYWNPKTSQYEESYGVIADTLVGNLILSNEVGIYNSSGSIVLDKDGLSILADATTGKSNVNFSISKKYIDSSGATKTQKMFYIDADGNIVMSGGSISWSVLPDDVANSGDILTKTSQLDNDAGFLTSANLPSISKLYTNMSSLYYKTTSTTAPSAPTSKVTSKSTSTKVWTTVVPSYDENYKIYTCNQLETNDGTVSWTPVIEYLSSEITTEITKDTVTTNYVNALNVTAVNIAANSVISNKITCSDIEITGGSISWSNVTNKPTIPSKTSQLSNDSSYATTSQIPTDTNQLTNGAGFITSATATQITKDTVTTTYINGLLVTARYISSDLVVSNKISVTSGTIGGWTIDSSSLYNTNSSNNTVYLSNGSNSTQDVLVVKAGSSYPFYVRANGYVSASDLHISGGSIDIPSITEGSNYINIYNGNSGCKIANNNIWMGYNSSQKYKTSIQVMPNGYWIYQGSTGSTGDNPSTTRVCHMVQYDSDKSTSSQYIYYGYSVWSDGTSVGRIWIDAKAETVTATQCVSASDIRQKNVIGEISEDEALVLLEEVKPINYTWKRAPEFGVNSGFSAQNIRDTLINHGIGYRSYLNITIHSDDDILTPPTTTTDIYMDEAAVTYSVDYAHLVSVLWKGWQIHESKIEELETKLEELKVE